MLQKILAITVLIFVIALPTSRGFAQGATDATVEEHASDPYGRISPRGTVDGYLRAMREADPAKAALFLDTRHLSPRDAQGRAVALKRLLDDGGYFFLTDEISASPEGHLNDEMSTDLEEVGAVQAGNQSVPLILQRVRTPGGSFIWLFSHATIEELPGLVRHVEASLLDKVLPQDLKRHKILTVPVGHWLAMIVIGGLSCLAGMVLARIVLRALDWLFSARLGSGMSLLGHRLSLPLAILIATVLYRQAVILVGVQVVARGATDWIAVTLLWLAVAMICLKLVDLLGVVLRKALHPEAHRSSVAALILLRKLVKAGILGVLTVQVLEILGFDVTTAIAALGIGGLALALGAQKTVENLVGSVNVVADRPVEVGDFCSFGGVSGTVEDIGIRSTRIRTQDRTIITVPNGVFATMQIENFSVRDRFLFDTALPLRPDTPAAQVRHIIEEIRDKLRQADNIAEGGRVHLGAVTRSSVEVEVFCYVLAPDFGTFLEAKEALLFFLLETTADAGAALAWPPDVWRAPRLRG